MHLHVYDKELCDIWPLLLRVAVRLLSEMLLFICLCVAIEVAELIFHVS